MVSLKPADKLIEELGGVEKTYEPLFLNSGSKDCVIGMDGYERSGYCFDNSDNPDSISTLLEKYSGTLCETKMERIAPIIRSYLSPIESDERYDILHRRRILQLVPELIENKMIHGNKGLPGKYVTLHLVRCNRGYLIDVSDEGEGFDVPSVFETCLKINGHDEEKTTGTSEEYKCGASKGYGFGTFALALAEQNGHAELFYDNDGKTMYIVVKDSSQPIKHSLPAAA